MDSIRHILLETHVPLWLTAVLCIVSAIASKLIFRKKVK
jgi:Na+-transporting NADH:ubiquinone oxidoreductase subunit NqrB